MLYEDVVSLQLLVGSSPIYITVQAVYKYYIECVTTDTMHVGFVYIHVAFIVFV